MKDSRNYESEFSPGEILTNMCHNIFKNYTTYEPLSINKEYLTHRTSIFKLMQKIIIKFGFKSQTFFLTAYYLDIIFIKKKKINFNYYKIGLACLCLSSKFCENDPIVPHLQYFVRLYNSITGYKNFISMSELMNAEVVACKILNYKLNYFSAYDFIAFFFCNGILKLEQIKDIESELSNKLKINNKANEEYKFDALFVKNILGKIYKTVRNYLDTVVKIDKICMKYDSLFIAMYLIEKSLEECLSNEYKKSKTNLNINKEDYKQNMKKFLVKNDNYFKEIMKEFYKIDFEDNEQYLELINDEEINCIFIKENKSKNRQNDENEKNKLFNSTMTSGFYKRLKLPLNNDTYKDSSDINDIKNNYKSKKREKEEEVKDKNYDADEEDDLDKNLNINELSKKINKKKENITEIKNIASKSINKINPFDYKDNGEKTAKNTPRKINRTKINFSNKNLHKYNSLNLNLNKSSQTLKNNNTKPYSKKLISGNKRNYIKSFEQSIKSSTSTNFYKPKINNTILTENNINKSNIDKNITVSKNAHYLKINEIKIKSKINNTAITKRYKKVIINKKDVPMKTKKLSKEKYEPAKFSTTGENFYTKKYNKIKINKISVNKLKDMSDTEMKNLNINKELKSKKLTTNFYKKKLNINNTSLKDINKSFSKNLSNENINKGKTVRENESNGLNLNKSTKYKKLDYAKIKNNYLITEKNKKTEIKKAFIKNKSSNNTLKEGHAFKTMNKINSNALSSKEYKTINKETTNSSGNNSGVQTTLSTFYTLIQKTKKFFTKRNNNNDNYNIKNKEKKKEKTKNINNNFYKSQQNFFKKEKDKNNDININNNINININIQNEIKIPSLNFNNTIITSNQNNLNIGNKFHTHRMSNHNNKLENINTATKPINIKNIFQKINKNRINNEKI